MIDDPDLCVLTHRHDPDRPRPAAPGLRCCRACRDRMRRQLRQLGPLDRVLAAAAASGSAGLAGSRSAETRLPLHDSAADHRKTIRHTLASWCSLVADQRRMTAPQLSAAPRTAPVRWEWTGRGLRAVSGTLSTVDHLSMWLQRHLDWLCAHDLAGDWASELGGLHSAAFGIAYPSGRRTRPVDFCRLELWSVATKLPYLCPGQLTVTMRPDDDLPDAVCDTCGDTVGPREWLTRAEKGRRLTAVELATVWDVSLRTVQRWASDDGWPSDGGRPARYDAAAAQATFVAYRVEDVDA